MLERAKISSTRLPQPPRAEPRAHSATWHGVTLSDEYAWLKAPNWQVGMRDPAKLDPAIRAYLEAENTYATAALADTIPLQETLFAEMKGRIEEDESTVPSADGPYAYFVRYREGGQHPIVCREPRQGGSAETLLDGDALGAGKSYFRLGGFDHSPDHKLLAWSVDETGSEFNTIRVRELATGADLPDAVPDATGGVVWSADGRTFLYVRLDSNHRPTRVYRHRLGTPPKQDVLVYQEKEPGFFVS